MAIRSPCCITGGWLSKPGPECRRNAPAPCLAQSSTPDNLWRFGVEILFAIRTTGLFPTMLLQMTAIGEESGSLDDMLGKVADHFEAAVDNAVDSLSSLIEPIIMSVLGVLIGGLMIAMYLPIFMLGSVI